MKTREIAEFVGGELHGNGDTEISGVASLSAAKSGDLAFCENLEIVFETNASCLLAPLNSLPNSAVDLILVENPKLEFARVARELHSPSSPTGRHESVIIHPDSDVRASFIGAFVSIGAKTTVGDSTEIHAGTKIGRNVTIGERTVIHSNCVLYDGVFVGDDCVIHSGVIVGADGFGFVRDETGEHVKFPQIGSVVIEDNVEIGANTCIDRGALGETRIGAGTKIDNLVQIAHNVQIGKRCVIAAQTGISGSSVIEDDVVIAGQVGIADHVRVKSGAILGAQCGVPTRKIIRKGVWWGTPAQPLDEFKKQHVHVRRLAKLRSDVDELKDKIGDPE